MLSKEQILKSVNYDPLTGIFTRKTTSKYSLRNNGKEIKTTDKDGYIVFKINGKMFKAHRVAYFLIHGEWPNQVDHINRITSDNRAENIRCASQGQNNQNRKIAKNNTSGTVGVRLQKYGKWRAYIYHNKKSIYLGEYITFEEALSARMAAVKVMFTHASFPPAST
jgi:hypothetical protein